MNTKWAPTELRSEWGNLEVWRDREKHIPRALPGTVEGGKLGGQWKEHWVTLWGSDGHYEAA